jgi:RNA-directed DNA polymerase
LCAAVAKAVFRRYRSQPIERVMNLINPVLRGWVNYFAVGPSSECFSFIKDWVEKKVRRHLAHAQTRQEALDTAAAKLT